jgi:hypothetical protein
MIDFSIEKDCINPDSFGEICVKCNACGRFDKDEMLIDRYIMFRHRLVEEIEKFNSDYYHTNLQQMNIAKNIIYNAEKLLECIEQMDFDGGKPGKEQIAKIFATDIAALCEDIKTNATRDICNICLHYENEISCDLECEKCKKQCICNTCKDCDKWEWRGE